MFTSGTSGHICKDSQHKYPYSIGGRILKMNTGNIIYELTTETNGWGKLEAANYSGASGMTDTLNATPSADCTFDSYEISGATLTGDTFTYTNTDVTAKANFNRNVHNLIISQTSYGTIAANKATGYSGDVITLSNTPDTDCYFNSYSVTGAILNGSDVTMSSNDATAAGSFSRNVHTITLQNNGYGTVTANKSTGYSGDVVTLTPTPNSGYSLTGYEVTGGTMTGNNVAFGTTNITAKANFGRVAYTLTVQTDGHGSATTSYTGYPGTTVTAINTPSSYYDFSGYALTGNGSFGTGNNRKIYTFGNGDATAKAIFSAKAWTASGTWSAGSDVYVSVSNYGSRTAEFGPFYALTGYKSYWAAGSNVDGGSNGIWKPKSDISGYSITLNGKLQLSGSCPYRYSSAAATAQILRGNTVIASQTFTRPNTSTNSAWTFTFNKSVTDTVLNNDYKLSAYATLGAHSSNAIALKYLASKTTGTWVATGYKK